MKTGTLKIKQLVAFALLLGGAFAALQGCQGKTPAAVVFGIPPKAPLASNIIDDLEDGNQLMSINLLGAASVPSTQYVVTPANPNNPSSSSTIQPVYMPSVPLGVWVASSWGGNAVSNVWMVLDGQGALGSSGYIHLYGDVTEPAIPPGGKAVYVAYQLEGKFKNGLPYDASSFTGVRFYYKLGSDDTCINYFHRFDVAIQQTLPLADGGDGTCNPGVTNHDCFDHFGADLPTNPKDTWVQRSFLFSSLARRNFGEPLPPACGTPGHPACGSTNLTNYKTNFVKLVWQHGRNGVPGTSHVNYAIDQVEFF